MMSVDRREGRKGVNEVAEGAELDYQDPPHRHLVVKSVSSWLLSGIVFCLTMVQRSVPVAETNAGHCDASPVAFASRNKRAICVSRRPRQQPRLVHADAQPRAVEFDARA
jgi:hypothetical protein